MAVFMLAIVVIIFGVTRLITRGRSAVRNPL